MLSKKDKIMRRQLAAVMKQSDFSRFDIQFFYQCAPVLLGVKVSNLFVIPKKDLLSLASLELPESIHYYLLYENERQLIYLIYQKEALQSLLLREEYEMLFRVMGYESTTLEEVLAEVSYRYGQCRQGQKKFPHEIGLLLGIPIADVLGFLLGRQELQSGEWKVYFDPEEAGRRFALYEKARMVCLELLQKQEKVQDILDLL